MEYVFDMGRHVLSAKYGEPAIVTMPFEDRREPIVRCRDCMNYDHGGGGLPNGCTLLDFATAEDMGGRFCAWGERGRG